MLVRDAVFGLDYLTVLRVSGGNALTWLQGQLTADLADVDASTSRIAAWCSPKGRVLAIFRVLADPAGGYRLVCERWFTAALLARLRMFILRSDVRIDDAGDALGVAGVAGARALPDRFETWAATAGVDDAATIGEVAVTRVPGRHRRFMVTGPHDRIASIVSPQAGGVPQAGPDAWRLADICAGVARVSEAMSDAFLPQMLESRTDRRRELREGMLRRPGESSPASSTWAASSAAGTSAGRARRPKATLSWTRRRTGRRRWEPSSRRSRIPTAAAPPSWCSTPPRHTLRGCAPAVRTDRRSAYRLPSTRRPRAETIGGTERGRRPPTRIAGFRPDRAGVRAMEPANPSPTAALPPRVPCAPLPP